MSGGALRKGRPSLEFYEKGGSSSMLRMDTLCMRTTRSNAHIFDRRVPSTQRPNLLHRRVKPRVRGRIFLSRRGAVERTTLKKTNVH